MDKALPFAGGTTVRYAGRYLTVTVLGQMVAFLLLLFLCCVSAKNPIIHASFVRVGSNGSDVLCSVHALAHQGAGPVVVSRSRGGWSERIAEGAAIGSHVEFASDPVALRRGDSVTVTAASGYSQTVMFRGAGRAGPVPESARLGAHGDIYFVGREGETMTGFVSWYATCVDPTTSEGKFVTTSGNATRGRDCEAVAIYTADRDIVSPPLPVTSACRLERTPLSGLSLLALSLVILAHHSNAHAFSFLTSASSS